MELHFVNDCDQQYIIVDEEGGCDAAVVNIARASATRSYYKPIVQILAIRSNLRRQHVVLTPQDVACTHPQSEFNPASL